VERGGDSRNRAIVLGGSPIDGPRSCEVRLSASPSCSVDTLSGESPSLRSPAEGLPPPTTKRWVVRRKAAVVAAVLRGEITLEEACRCYQLSEEELLSWERAFQTHGLAGLRVTRIQQYRGPRPPRPRSASLKEVAESALIRRA
jgi:hypothetical protein